MSDVRSPGQHHFVDWEPRRATTLAAARRRAALGRVLRLAFWGGAMALAAGAAYYFLLTPDETPLEPEPPPTEAEAGVVRVTNMDFAGRDAQNRPFRVLAETAIRRPQDGSNITELEFPRFLDGSRDDADPSEARVRAQRGLYDSDANVLELFADVDLETESGYAFRTSHARIYIDERRAEGDEPVEGEGPWGTVTADRWSYSEDGSILRFEGNVRTVINSGSPDQQEDAGQ